MNKIKIYAVSIPIFIVLASLLINSSYAQSSDNFKTYSNNDMKFSIQHPSNWKPEYSKFEPDLINFSVVYFSAPNKDSPNDYFQVGMEEVKPYLDTDTMTLKNTSLQQRVQKELDDHLSSDKEKIIRQNWVTVGGNPAYKIEYTWSCKDCSLNDPTFGLPDRYSFQIFTFANGKFYRLSYGDDPLKVPETLPLANKMVESFQVNSGDKDTSNNSAVEDTSNNSTFEDNQNKNCSPMSLVLCREPRCPDGYHRSPDGDCEPARDNFSHGQEWNTTQQMQNNQTHGTLLKHKGQVYCYDETTTTKQEVLDAINHDWINLTNEYVMKILTGLSEDNWELAITGCQHMILNGDITRETYLDKPLELEGR